MFETQKNKCWYSWKSNRSECSPLLLVFIVFVFTSMFQHHHLRISLSVRIRPSQGWELGSIPRYGTLLFTFNLPATLLHFFLRTFLLAHFGSNVFTTLQIQTPPLSWFSFVFVQVSCSVRGCGPESKGTASWRTDATPWPTVKAKVAHGVRSAEQSGERRPRCANRRALQVSPMLRLRHKLLTQSGSIAPWSS